MHLGLGTRMWRRGANLEGDTANFIETEQLLEFGDHICSFLQVCFSYDHALLCVLAALISSILLASLSYE